MNRKPEDWTRILAGTTPEKAAERILGDLVAYPSKGTMRYDQHSPGDIEQLANVIRAVRAMK